MFNKLLFIPILFLASQAFAGTIYYKNGTSAAPPSGSPLTYVQSVSTNGTNGGCGSTLTAMTVTSGNMLVIGCATTSNASGMTPSDDKSNVWVNAGTASNGASNLVGIWYVKSAAAGATNVTVATNGCNGVNVCILAEYSGQHTTSTFDVFSGSAPAATGLPPTNLAATTTGSNRLMFAFLYNNSGGAITATSGTIRHQTVSNPQMLIQDINVPSAGSYQSTWTETGPYAWMAAQAAFNPQ